LTIWHCHVSAELTKNALLSDCFLPIVPIGYLLKFSFAISLYLHFDIFDFL